MGWRLQISDKTVRKLAELPIYGSVTTLDNCPPPSMTIRIFIFYASVLPVPLSPHFEDKGVDTVTVTVNGLKLY